MLVVFSDTSSSPALLPPSYVLSLSGCVLASGCCSTSSPMPCFTSARRCYHHLFSCCLSIISSLTWLLFLLRALWSPIVLVFPILALAIIHWLVCMIPTKQQLVENAMICSKSLVRWRNTNGSTPTQLCTTL